MKIWDIAIDAAIIACITVSSFPLQGSAAAVSPVAAPDTAGLFEETELFVGGQDGINTYRIPSIICTANGTILAFCEGRRDKSEDGSPTHIVLKRCLNAGSMVPPTHAVSESRSRERNMTWQTMQMILESKNDDAYMNPVPVINSHDGSVFLLVNHYLHYGEAENEGKGATEVLVLRSTDNGATWSKPEKIAGSAGNTALGPGIGIQLRDGRLVAPVYDGVIYSDDNGKTWIAGKKTPAPLNECQVAELADGSLMLNTRGYPYRTITISHDKGSSWGEKRTDTTLTDPRLWGGCQASLIRYSRQDNGGDKNRLLFSAPSDTILRLDMRVRVSYDEGRSWTVSRLIHSGSGAYSCLTVLPDGTIGILYETGRSGNGVSEYCAKIDFARFNLEWLTGGDDKPLR